jgi:dTDP-4-amino-4,6-dideoxygalactose transaminase
MTIPLIDLRAQYGEIRDEVDQAISEVLETQRFILGPAVERFEEAMADYLGVPHAIGCASGTDALLLVLRALELSPGDEVILPAFTFFATAGAVWNAGLRPVFCDVDPETFNVTADTVADRWSDRTRAVIPVHLFGQMAPMKELREVADARGAFLLEDAAQAIGAQQNLGGPGSGKVWVRAGAAGGAGAFSFFPTKNLGSYGDGGLVSAADDELADRVAKLRVHGGRQMYHHEMVGTNSRLDALQAAVLLAKLPHMDRWNEARSANAARYDQMFRDIPDVRTPVRRCENKHVFHQYTVRVPRRDELQDFLASQGIGSGVYYPTPLHLQQCFGDLGYRPGDLPQSEALCQEVLSLPVYPELRLEDQESVVAAVERFYQEG